MAGDNLKLKGKIEEFYLQLIPVLQKFPRAQRYTLAENIEKETLACIKFVLEAEYNKSGRLESLQRLRTTLHTVTILLRVSSRSSLLKEESYEQLCRATSELGKITSGWIKNETSPGAKDYQSQAPCYRVFTKRPMRKRKAYGLFEPMTEFSNLLQAFYRAAKGKKNRMAVLSFQSHLEDNIFDIQERLRNETYPFGPYRSFYVTEPKLRLIESACFQDRVVHHAMYERLEPLFDAQFYEYSFACRNGRGTHAAMLTLGDWINRSRLPTFLKCDIRRFFTSVDRPTLVSILQKSVGDEKMMRLLERLILSAPRTGIPIGNLTSQLLANLYMNELDQFVKRELRVKYYVRYMDDFILLTESHDEARSLKETIRQFVEDKLKLELSPEKVRIGHVQEGVPFVGYCQRPGEIRVRGAALRRMRKKVRKAYRKSFGQNYEMPEDFWESPKIKRSRFYASWSSYVGQTKYAKNSIYLREKMIKELEILPP